MVSSPLATPAKIHFPNEVAITGVSMWTPFGGTTIQPALIHCVYSAPRVGFWGPWPVVDDLIKPHPPVWAWASSCWKQADRLGFLPPLMVCADGVQMLLGCGGVKRGGRQEQDRTRGQRRAHTQQFCGKPGQWWADSHHLECQG